LIFWENFKNHGFSLVKKNPTASLRKSSFKRKPLKQQSTSINTNDILTTTDNTILTQDGE